MAGEIMSKVAFSSKVPLLMKATSDSSQPTPGYLFEDIQKISYESIDYCIYMADFLIDRLKKKSLHVKLKALQVIRYVVDRGHREFTIYIRKNSNSIRELQSLNGPPDILHGDAFYVNIRNAATELLTILFDLERDQHFKQTSWVSSDPIEKCFGKLHQGSGIAQSSSGFGISSPPSNSNILSSIYDKVKEVIPSFLQTQTESQLVKDNYYQQFNETPKINSPSDTIWSFVGQKSNGVMSKKDNDSSGYQSPVLNNTLDYQPPVSNSFSHRNNIQTNQDASLRETPKSSENIKVSETTKTSETTILTEVPDTLFQGLCVQERSKPNNSSEIYTTKCENQYEQSLLNDQFSCFMSNTQNSKNNFLNDDLSEKNWLFSSFNEGNVVKTEANCYVTSNGTANSYDSYHVNKSNTIKNNDNKSLSFNSQKHSYNDSSFILPNDVNQKQNCLESLPTSLYKQSTEKQNRETEEYLVSQSTYRAQLLQSVGNSSEKSLTNAFIQNQQQTAAVKLKELDNFDPFSVEIPSTNHTMTYAANLHQNQPPQTQYPSNPTVFQNSAIQRFPQQQQNNFHFQNSFHQQNVPRYLGNCTYNNHAPLGTNEIVLSPSQNVTGFTSQRPAVRISNTQVKDSFSFVQDAMKSSMNK
ncbi:uncharacterized protein LOC101234304 isoform X1 [Hydra vulgaris]|uniref:uncharacterized protein LOC101234304 isoform X1 n=1 Tax=Hydra vulgaris TaxID=6087 RepID=UPI001F5F0EFF|nr:uncharacterized protein LOC101234304 isoform X2 [Hydra vulgaris]